MRFGSVEIEVHITDSAERGRFRIVGDDEVLWTNDIDEALSYVRDSLESLADGAMAEEE